MRSILSYFLLITLLFPSIVETIHAIEESHTTHEDSFLNFDEERHTCNLGLYFSFDVDNSSFDSTLDFDSFILFERNLEKSSNLISRINFNDIRYRGPPSV